MQSLPIHEFVPSIPQTELDRSALALRASCLGASPLTAAFGHGDCPAGAAGIESLGCYWNFDAGATKVIERLSLGTSNAWRLAWICEPDTATGTAPLSRAEPARVLASLPSKQHWTVRHDMVGLSVFPLGINAVLASDGAQTAIPAGTVVGSISFSPNGRKAFDPGNLFAAVARSFAGFEILFGCMEEAMSRGLTAPAYFLGDALEKRMCTFLQRQFGFQLIDTGEFGASVYAPVGTVMEHVRADPGRPARFALRAERERTRQRDNPAS